MAGLHEAGALLLAHGKQAIWAHAQAVAEEAGRIARRFGIDEARCVQAGLCHDVGGILTPEEMTRQARERGLVLDPAEERYPFLLHQRFSQILCRERLGIEDAPVLSAVGCHTTLRREATLVDMVVFIADKLAWDQAGTPPYARAVRQAMTISLPAACLAQIDYTLDNGMILMPHGWLLQARHWLRQITA